MMKKWVFALAGVAIIGTGAYIGYEHVSSKGSVDSDIQVAPEQSSSERKAKDVSEEQDADESQNTDNTQQQESESGEASRTTNQTSQADGTTTDSYHEAMKTGKKYVGPQNAPEGGVKYVGQKKQMELLDAGEADALPAGGLHFEENDKGAGLFDDKGMMWTLDEKGIAWPMD